MHETAKDRTTKEWLMTLKSSVPNGRDFRFICIFFHWASLQNPEPHFPCKNIPSLYF